MLQILSFLTPNAGQALVEQVNAVPELSMEAALVPEEDSLAMEKLIRLLKEEDVRYRVFSDLNTRSLQQWLQKQPVDIGICAGFDRKIPSAVFDYPLHGTVNVHSSLLPAYRGYDPFFWVIRNREPTTGVTLHQMTERLDAGPIFHQEEKNVQPDDTKLSLYLRLTRLGLELLVEFLSEVEQTGSLPAGRHQPVEVDAPRAPKVTENDLWIDWNRSYEEIDALVRAAFPFHGARTEHAEEPWIVYEVHRLDRNLKIDERQVPGQSVTGIEQEAVYCKDGVVCLDRYEVAR